MTTNKVYDFCRCIDTGDLCKITHNHKGCLHDNREMIATYDKEKDVFKIIMDSYNGVSVGATISRNSLTKHHVFEKIENV